MFGGTFEWIMAAICTVCAVLLLSGHGDVLMKYFGSAERPSMKVEKKRSKEQESRYQRALGAYCAVLAVAEVVLALFGSTSRVIPIVTICIAVLGLICIVHFNKHNS